MAAWIGKFLAAACAFGLLAGGAAQAQAKKEARLFVEDGAGLFSESAVKSAKNTIAEVRGDRDREVHIHTYKALAESERKELDAAKDAAAKQSFWSKWSNGKIKDDNDKGVAIFITMDPPHVEVRVSSTYEKEGFTGDITGKTREVLVNGLRDAGKKASDTDKEVARNAALLETCKYLAQHLPSKSAKKETNRGGNVNEEAPAHEKQGSGIMTYVCIGIAVLAGIWLISGLFRAMSGGGGGMGGGGGGMMGGGGGGGGFMSGMLGGLFGAVAGNYLYNNMFGGHDSSSYGGGNSDNSGGGYDTSGSGDNDFSGGNSSGGDFGDTGGGGGDFGGGGDMGGGGGDFGGGGGDF